MTSAPRFRQMLARARRLAPAAGVLAAFALGATALPAGAVVVEVEAVKAGVQPRNEAFVLDGDLPSASEFANPHGAPVVTSSRVYAIYWDPTDNYHGDWQQHIDTFLQNMGAESGTLGNVFAVDTQYTDKANQHAAYQSTFMGAYTDTDPYPVKPGCIDQAPLLPGDAITCLSDQQIRTELQAFIAQHSLPKGMNTIFYVLTPLGVTVCLDGGGPGGHCSDNDATLESYENSFCSYHSAITANPTSGDANTILYGMIPWTAGGLGDYHIFGEDETPAYNCQDGGFDPSSKPIEKKEKKKEKTKEQEEELKEKRKKETKEEIRKEEEQEYLEGPHQQEPNQLATERGADGSFDSALSDLIINQIAVEQQNIVTDPLLNAWQDPIGYEATDECRNFFFGTLGGSVDANEATGSGTLSNQVISGGNYYLNDAFDLAALKLPYPGVPCIGGLHLNPQFTSPNPVNPGEIVGFNGMESDITLDWGTVYSAAGEAKPTYATYKWNFGDGTPEVTGYAPGGPLVNSASTPCPNTWESPCAAGVFHSYQYGGTYTVTLTATDVAGDVAQISHPITVNGPTRPAEPEPTEPEPGSGGSSGSGASATAQSRSTTPVAAPAAQPAVPGPVASAAAVSSSLKQVARRGLVVHYTVNEQVAGHFEVLLAADTAHGLGIGGRGATGLPAGFPKSLVIGQALLVTTKGGHSSVRIKFSKSTAKHLRRAHSVKLTLRLVVRNASSTSPIFTTVMSNVVLHR